MSKDAKSRKTGAKTPKIPAPASANPAAASKFSDGEGATRAALSAVSKISRIKGMNRGLSARAGALALELASVVAFGAVKFLSTSGDGRAEKLSSTHLSSSEISLDGKQISGWLIMASAGNAGAFTIVFRAEAEHPAKIIEASISEANCPPSPSHVFLAPGNAAPPANLAELAKISRALFEQRMMDAKVWGVLPPDFQSRWCAALAEPLSALSNFLPKAAASRLFMQIEGAIRQRNAVIESEVGDSGKPVFFLDLPSFSVSFEILPDGTQQVLSVSGKEKFLIFSKNRVYYQKKG